MRVEPMTGLRKKYFDGSEKGPRDVGHASVADSSISQPTNRRGYRMLIHGITTL